ncbi:riboflavin synthase [Hugenholtzia roseola]|uniref:riboflavin synthase n=1 Tax=Hugenholtzia roseola TaxID=1002 RepID=UPI0004109549|nr:riboflavin synthase [Hugenholtzia roseola]
MFTGIVETLGEVIALEKEQSNLNLTISSSVSDALKIDQSVAHNGICLTVTAVGEDSAGAWHRVTAISETIEKTNIGSWKVGDGVNIERCLSAQGRFDGHIVQGHVDQIGICVVAEETAGSWRYAFEYEPQSDFFTVQKGSICVNGVSLTVVESRQGYFSVAIIPYTYAHTNFKTLQVGDKVNLEFDIIGKYVQTWLARQQKG